MKKTVIKLFLGVIVLCSCERLSVSDIDDTPAMSKASYAMPIGDNDKVTYWDSIIAIENWRKYEDLKSKQQALNLPQKMLDTISTKQLVAMCMQYPMWDNYSAFNSPIMGINSVISGFNGFAELRKRKDYAKEILDYLVRLNLKISVEPSTHNRMIRAYAETIISSMYFEDIFENANVLRLEAYISMRQITEEAKSHLLATKISSDLLKIIIDGKKSHLSRPALLSQLNVYDCPSKRTVTWDTVHTHFGKSVYCHVIENCSPEELALHDSYYISMHPNATLISHSSHKYNCHSYAWNIYGRENFCRYLWINEKDDDGEDNLSKYWTGDLYREVIDSRDTPIRIYYANHDHSAVGPFSDGKVLSKWGFGPVMRHSIHDCPYDTPNIKYYCRIGGYYPMQTSVGEREVYVGESVTYWCQTQYTNSAPLIYSYIQIEDMHQNDAIDNGKASVIRLSETSYRITFNRAGIYEISIQGRDSRGEFIVNYSYEAIVEN